MGDVKTDIDAVLEDAAEPEVELPESSTGEETEETEVKDADDKDSKKGKGAQDRIRELAKKEKELVAQLEKAQGTLSERDQEISKLLDLVQAREEDSRVIRRVNELYQDEKNRPFIEYLDKLVRGEEVDTVPEFETKKQKENFEEGAELLKKLSETRSELEKSVSDQKAELILDKADRLTDKLVAELPDEYTDEDKKILQRVLVEEVDWDSVEESGGQNLSEALSEGWQKTLDWYGRPKGLSNQSKENENKQKEQETPEQVEAKFRRFIDQPWGELEERKDAKGKTVKAPKVSDEDFTRALGQLFKRQNMGS